MTTALFPSLGLLSAKRKIILAAVTIFSASAAHFAGFLTNVPRGMERLVATSFAGEFIALFLYYAAASAVLARVIHHLLLVGVELVPYMWYRLRAALSRRYARKYLRRSRKDLAFHDGSSWLLWALSFAILYVDLGNIEPFYSAILVALPVILLLRFPHLALSPRLFYARMKSPSRRTFQLQYGSEAILVLAGLTVVFAFILGDARFRFLANAPMTKYVDSRYSSDLVILIRANSMTLALERLEEKKRFLVFHEDFIAAETRPNDAEGFPSLAAPKR